MSNDLRDKPESYWKEKLTPEQYKITRQKGTEPPFSGSLYYNHDQGMYVCVACGHPLFSSDAKFESGTGWPSFYQPIAEENVESITDNSFGMRRVAVECKRCGAHLGHVFMGERFTPKNTRHCVNSISMRFIPAEQGGE